MAPKKRASPKRQGRATRRELDVKASDIASLMAMNPDSLGPPFLLSLLNKFQKWLHRAEYTKIKFDPEYVEFLQEFNGGVPDAKYFESKRGTAHVVERFLCFVPTKHKLSLYGVEQVWSSISDRIGDTLMPFASLFGGDLAMFECESGRPRVVIWFHDRSLPDMPPCVEEVADTFREFLQLLRPEPPKPSRSAQRRR